MRASFEIRAEKSNHSFKKKTIYTYKNENASQSGNYPALATTAQTQFEKHATQFYNHIIHEAHHFSSFFFFWNFAKFAIFDQFFDTTDMDFKFGSNITNTQDNRWYLCENAAFAGAQLNVSIFMICQKRRRRREKHNWILSQSADVDSQLCARERVRAVCIRNVDANQPQPLWIVTH